MFSHGASTRVRRGSIAVAWAMLAGTVVVAALPPTPVSAVGPYTVTVTTDGPDSNLADGFCISTAGGCSFRAAIQQALADSDSDVSIGFGVSGPFQLLTDLTAEVPQGKTVVLGSVADWSTSGPGALQLLGFNVGNPLGGGPNSSACAVGEALTGLEAHQSTAGTWLRAIRPICRPFVLTLGNVGLGLAYRGALFGTLVGGEPQSVVECPDGSVVTGFGGRSGSLIDQLQLYCAPLDTDGSLGGSVLATGSVGGIGGGQFAPIGCPTGTLASGVTGRTGQDIDQFGLTCVGRIFTVNHTGDDADLTPGDGVCITSAGVCTLRAAIQEANASIGYDRIRFGIPDATPGATGVLNIGVSTPLPSITNPVLIDGYTQANAQPNSNAFPLPFNGILRIQISRSAPLTTGSGLVLATGAAGSVVRGLIINGFTGYPTAGVRLGTRATIEGNYIGTNAAGSAAAPNHYGVLVGDGSDGGMIGGASPASRNLISGNIDDGVYAYNPISGDSTNLTVQGNFIGTDATGMVAVANLSGICPCSDLGHFTIKDNLLSGNRASGIWTQGPDAVIVGNLIGVNRTGTAALPNGQAGIFLGFSTRVTIGDGTDAGRNVIAGNTGAANLGAIYGFFNGSGDSWIRGNYIGVGTNGVTPIGNSRGIDITTATGSPGVVHIGGQLPGEGNVIANSTEGDGVRLNGGLGSTPVRIVGNSIYDNFGIGINLGAGANDVGDADEGPNRLQNSPTITAVSVGGQVGVNYTIDSAVSSSVYPIQIDVYAADDAASGEGQRFLGRQTIGAPGSGSISLGAAGAGTNIGDPIVATATDAAGNTSEFSNVALVIDGNVDETLALTVSLSIACDCDSSFVVGAAGVPVRDFDRKATEVASSATIAASSISAIGPADTSLAAITIGSTPLRAIVLGSTPLRAISLVDVDVDGGWSTLLAGTDLVNQPLSTLTLGEAFDNATVSNRLATTPLRAIDVNGTPLSAIPLAAIALGSTPLSAITLPDDGTGENAWCAILADVLAITGETCVQALTQNLMALSLRGASLSPAPLRAIPLRAIPLEATDAAAAPLRAIELQDTNLAASPLRAIPLRAIDLQAANVAAAPLRAIPLSAIPLRAIPLSAIPLQASAIPIDDELRELPTSMTLEASPLRAIDAAGTPLSAIQVQGAPLAEVPLSAIVLADVPLSAIPLDGVAPGDLNAAWCTLLADAGSGFDCSSGASPTTTTLRDISVHGVPLRAIPLRAINLSSINLAASPLRAIPLSAIPLRAIPLRAIDLNSVSLSGTPLRAIPLRAIDVAGSPLSAIPLRAIDIAGSPLRAISLSALPLSAIPLRAIDLEVISVANTPLRAIPLRAIDVQASPLRAIPLRAIPPTVNINCSLVDCTNGTLGDAFAKGAVPATTTLGDIQAATTGIRLGELAPHLFGITEAQLLAAIAAANLTINDLRVNGASDFDDLTIGDIPFSSAVFDQIILGDLGTFLADITFADLVAALRDQIGAAQLRTQIDALLLTLGDLDSLGDVTIGDLLGDGSDRGAPLTLADLEPLLGFITVEALETILDRPLGTLDCGGVSCTAGTLGLLSPEALGRLTLQDLIGLPAFDGLTIGQLLTQLVPDAVLDGFTLGDLLLALLDPASLAKGSVDLRSVDVASLPPAAIDFKPFSAGFTLTASTPQNVTVEIVMPAGAVYVAGSGVVQSFGPTGATQRLEPTIIGQTLSWTVTAAPGVPHAISFNMTAGLRLGSATVAATGRIVGTDIIVPASTGVDVVEGLEPNDFALVTGSRQTTPADPDNVYLTYIASKTDIDVFEIVVPEGGELVVGLSNLDADLDLALWGRPASPGAGAALGPVSADDPLNPITDPDAAGTDAEALNDFQRLDALDPSLQLISVSNLAGTNSESIATDRLPAGTYYVQVYGANGAVSTNPAALQLKINAAETPPACRATTAPFGPGAFPTIPTSVPASANTLILVNESRTEQFYGPAARTAVTDAITRLTTYLTANPQLGLDPMVIPVDGDASVRSAYATWDSLPGACSPDAANTVVSRINSLIDPARAQFEHIVIVGGDELIPMARLSDRTQVANEYDFRHEFDGSLTGVNPNGRNAMTSHLWESDILSDEPYGDAAARSLGDRYLYVTDAALGRLVETPAEIVDALDTFVQFQGTLQIDTATVLGYDFLADGSATVAGELEAALPGAVDTDLADGFDAAGQPWDRTDAVDAIARARTNALISLNAHFDHYRALPAAGDQVPGFTDNLIAEDVANALGNGPDLSQSLVFSMGCHSGLSVSDILIGSTNQDWAQQLANERALFVGNTGFGYGDTVSVAYTEQLMTLFADQVTSPFDLDPSATVSSSTVGQALAWAKNQYVAGLQTFSVYDEKAVMESTFYGLPFYRVGLATQTLPPTPTRQAAPDATGTPASTAIVDALNEPVTAPNDGGTYYRNFVDGVEQTIVAPGRPIQPKTVTDISVVSPADPTALAQVAHGAMVLSMVSDYISLPNPVIATPVFDESATQPEPEVGDLAFPTKPLEITTSTGPSGQRQQLVLATGQYRSDNGGVQRLDDDIDVVVYYADPDETDFLPPTIGTVESEVAGGRLSLSVTAEDGSVVDRVFVLVAQNPGSGLDKQWTGIDLVQTTGTDRWTGSLALSPGTTSVEFIVQAKDEAGNVGFATNKALNFVNDLQPAVQLPPPPPAVLTAEANGTAAENGWFAGDVTVTVTTATSAVYSIDGVVSNNLLEGTESFIITGEGPHTWTVTTSDGAYSRSETVLIDGTGPVVTADPPPGPQSVTSVNLTAADPGSGPISLTYTVNRNGTLTGPTVVPGSTAAVELAATGTTTITARATDFAGNLGQQFTFTYTIDMVAPTLTALLDPLANDAGWNMGPVTVNWLAEDEGVVLPSPPSTTLMNETAGTTVTAQSCDLAGNCTTASVVVKVDMTAPGLDVSTSLDGNSVGWNNTSVEVSAACTDALSGVLSCPPPVTLTTEADDHIVSFSAEDVAGNFETASSRTIKIDLTNPVITVNGPANGALVTGPYTRPTCTAIDALSGMDGICVPTFADTIAVVGGYTETATFTAHDRAGNVETVVRTYTVRTDADGPVINTTTDPLPNGDGWWNTAVTYSFDCIDSSGVATCPDPRTLSTQGANQSFTVTATDSLGIETSLLVSGINIDLTPPVVTVTAPTNVGPADTVTITCAASDALSGIATAMCADQTFAASTLIPGANVFTFSATDVAGNTTTVTRTITLVVNAAPSVLADMGVAGLNDIGFKSRIVIVTGSFADPGGPGPFTASVQWTAGGPFTQLILNNDTDFVAANIYPSAGARTVTVRICDAGGACGTDSLTVRASVTQRITPVRECVVDRGAGVSPRYLARWGYNNPASFAIAVPSVPILQNTFTNAPFLRGQPQIFLPGQRRGVFTNTFASGTQTWRIDGNTASAAPNSPAC